MSLLYYANKKLEIKNKIRIYEEILLLHIRAGIITTKCSDTRVHVSLAL